MECVSSATPGRDHAGRSPTSVTSCPSARNSRSSARANISDPPTVERSFFAMTTRTAEAYEEPSARPMHLEHVGLEPSSDLARDLGTRDRFAFQAHAMHAFAAERRAARSARERRLQKTLVKRVDDSRAQASDHLIAERGRR